MVSTVQDDKFSASWGHIRFHLYKRDADKLDNERAVSTHSLSTGRGSNVISTGIRDEFKTSPATCQR
jgi:hypothetical protein